MRYLSAVLLLSAVPACRPAPPANGDTGQRNNNDSAQVAGVEQRFVRAFSTQDSAALDSLLDPAFSLVGQDPSRPVLDRAGFLHEILRAPRVTEHLQIGRFEQTGDSADIALALTYSPALGRTGGASVDVYWADRWLRRNGTWRLVQRQEVPQ